MSNQVDKISKMLWAYFRRHLNQQLTHTLLAPPHNSSNIHKYKNN